MVTSRPLRTFPPSSFRWAAAARAQAERAFRRLETGFAGYAPKPP